MSEAAQALGQKLKAEREKRGMSAQKMADDMHLDAWVIDALEAGDYERIGPSVYSQGHLKKYASILGVLAAQPAPAPQAKSAGPAVPTPIIRLDPPGAGGGAVWPTAGGFAVIALVAGGIAWWHPWRPGPAVARAPVAAGAPAAPGAASVAAPEASPATEPAGAQGTDTADGGGETQAASATAAPAIRATAAAAPPAAAADLTPGVGRARLRLSFSADSRVAVYDYTGKSVFTGKGRANSVKTLSGMAPFRVYLGYASGVQLQVNERAVAIGPQFVSGEVARFEAGADGVLRRDPSRMPAGTAAPPPPAPAAPRG